MYIDEIPSSRAVTLCKDWTIPGLNGNPHDFHPTIGHTLAQRTLLHLLASSRHLTLEDRSAHQLHRTPSIELQSPAPSSKSTSGLVVEMKRSSGPPRPAECTATRKRIEFGIFAYQSGRYLEEARINGWKQTQAAHRSHKAHLSTMPRYIACRTCASLVSTLSLPPRRSISLSLTRFALSDGTNKTSVDTKTYKTASTSTLWRAETQGL